MSEKSAVNVFLSTPLSEKGRKELEYEVEDMLELMEVLFLEHDKLENLVIDNGYIADYIQIFINDDQLKRDYSNLNEVELEEGDEVSLIASVSGGDEIVVTKSATIEKDTEIEGKENDSEEDDDRKKLKDFLIELLKGKKQGRVDFHQRRDQRYPVSMVQEMLANLNPDEVSELFDEYKDLFTPGMLGGTAGQSSWYYSNDSNEEVGFVEKLKPKDKAYIAKQEIKSNGTYNYSKPKLDIFYDVQKEEFFDELTALQTAKFIHGSDADQLEQLAENFGIDFFKNKMKKLIFQKSDDRAKTALQLLEDNASESS